MRGCNKYYTCSVVRVDAIGSFIRCYADITSELLVSDEAEFTNFIRMNKATFDIPLVLGNTRYESNETAFGDSIAGETSRNLT